jgi:hypothetical protein
MSTQINVRPRKLLLGRTVPNYVPIKIGHLFFTDKDGKCEYDKINKKPSYQRDYDWPKKTACNFINSIMTNAIIPGLINYELQDNDDGVDEYAYECVDGQHRLRTINAYRNGIYINSQNKKRFMVMWIYENEDTNEKEYVFYSENDNVTEWCAKEKIKPKYMTKTEKDHFDNYALEMRTICHKLSLDQRCNMFNSLQNGVQVKNSDYLKNVISNKFISYLRKYDFETKMKILLNNNSTIRAVKYWVQWLTRMYFIFKEKLKENYNNDDISILFLKKDTTYKELIEEGYEKRMMEISEKEEILFYNQFNRFYNFITLFDFKFDPTKMFTLFAHLINNHENREQTLFTNMYFWHNNYYNHIEKIAKKMWEGKAKDEERKQYFVECIEHLEQYEEPAKEPIKKIIKQKLKNKVWLNTFGNDKNGACPCGFDIHINDCEFGHIKSWACGGQTNEDNLKPICKRCNRSMGIRNMNDYFNEILIL